MSDEPSESIFGGVQAMLDDLEELYKEVHRRPELSMEEERTAALAAEWMGRCTRADTTCTSPGS